MFIESGGEIHISLYYKRASNGTVRVETDLKMIPEKERDKYIKAEFSLKPLTWKQHNDIQRSAMVNRGPGVGTELDWVLYKERKLCEVLVGWDAKDKNDKPIPVKEEHIFKLSPQIAEVLLQEFDKASVMGEEERKN